MLFLISRIGQTDYDEYDSFVVRAPSEEKARKAIVATHFPVEYSWHAVERKVWLDPTKSTCERLRAGGKAAVVLGSYNAG